MVTLTTTLPLRPGAPSAGSKSGSYTLSVQLHQEDPLCLKAQRALFEDLTGETRVHGKCPEGHVRQMSRGKAVLEWKSGCCGEDQSHTRSRPFSSVQHRQSVCVYVWSGVTMCACVCLIWFITRLPLPTVTAHTVAHTHPLGRQDRHSHTNTQPRTNIALIVTHSHCVTLRFIHPLSHEKIRLAQ